MNNIISKITKYFLYSILVVLIGKFIFYIPNILYYKYG